jgi:uracil-DNA glycosylase family 4
MITHKTRKIIMTPKEYKQQLLDALYAPYKKCTRCPLGTQGRTQVVFGEGNPDARLMFIGEGPGADEDAQGRPFVGRSGKLLTRIIESTGLTREDVFITNIVKCRPPNNRKPLPTESTTCKQLLLLKQIKIIRPKVICTLGSSALSGLINDDTVKITRARGTPIPFEDSIIIPAYHPAYILRNQKELPLLIADIQKAYEVSK